MLQRTGPLSLELAAQLEADIKSGALLPGTRLPPQRELADFLDVNLSTVSRAFRLCTQKGLLSATVGSGTFVAYDALASLSLLPHPDKPSLIELGSLLPTTPPTARWPKCCARWPRRATWSACSATAA